MIENILTKKQASLRVKLTVKTLISTAIIILAVVLPQIAHVAAGAQAGITLLPMYLPVLLGGCLLGPVWGLGVGVLSPLASFLITSALGTPMPAAARLPFMMAELAVFALVTGLFSQKIEKHAWLAFPAVLLAQVSGRAFLLLAVALFQSITPFTVTAIWGQIKTGLIGIVLQAAIVPLTVIGLKYLLDKENSRD